MSDKIYKICQFQEWKTTCIKSVYAGSMVDLQDGFIHFSTQQQLNTTARKHFHGQRNLIQIEIDEKNLDLTWDLSRGGELFAHLYDELPITGLEKTRLLALDANNAPVLPFLIKKNSVQENENKGISAYMQKISFNISNDFCQMTKTVKLNPD